MTTPVGDEGGQLRQFRPARASAPIMRDLYASTSDPTVLAFQLGTMFEGKEGATAKVTLKALRARWGVGRPKAAAARRHLINAGYWVALRMPTGVAGQWRSETVTYEMPFTYEDLGELARECPPGTRLECSGDAYVVDKEHHLVPRGAENCHSDRPAEIRRRVAENCKSARPAKTSAGVQKTATRPDQARSRKPAVRTESQKTVTPTSSPYGDDVKHHHESATAHGDDDVQKFWDEISIVVAVQAPGRRSVDKTVREALEGDWTPVELAAWVLAALRDAGPRITKPAGFVISTLRGDIPATPPPKAPSGPFLPDWCTKCGTDYPPTWPKARAKFRTVRNPDGLEEPCGTCHPDRHVKAEAS